MAEREALQLTPAAAPFHEVDHVERLFADVDQQARRFERHDFVGCTFERCRLAGGMFDHCRFEHCTFSACDLSVCQLGHSTFVEVRFEGCKMRGIDWSQANPLIFRVGFERCVLSDSSFARLDLHGITLASCIAHDCDFLDANLVGAICRGTDFARSRFLHTDLSAADFSGAVRYSIDPLANNVRAAVFSLPEAVSLLTGFGVIIR